MGSSQASYGREKLIRESGDSGEQKSTSEVQRHIIRMRGRSAASFRKVRAVYFYLAINLG